MADHARKTSANGSLAETARDEAAKVARDAEETVRATARQHAEELRDGAAEEAEKAANAAEAASDEFDSQSLQARATGHVADQLEDLAKQVRQTDIDQLSRTVSSFARENPLLFAGAGAVLGFALTRFLRSERPEPPRPEMRRDVARTTVQADDPWSRDWIDETGA